MIACKPKLIGIDGGGWLTQSKVRPYCQDKAVHPQLEA
jgi:hypothetical protein